MNNPTPAVYDHDKISGNYLRHSNVGSLNSYQMYLDFALLLKVKRFCWVEVVVVSGRDLSSTLYLFAVSS